MTMKNPVLTVGQSFRLTPGGPVVTVRRVTPCAAYVGIPRTKPHPDCERAAAGETITSTSLEAISARSFVYAV